MNRRGQIKTNPKRLGFAPLVRLLAVALGLPCWVPVAHSWNESGHRVIAAAAARQMVPELRAEVVRVLQAHPRYQEDLAAFRPRSLKGLSEAEWLMGQAAQWPDRIRRFDHEPRKKRDSLVAEYHRADWHYINLPVYLSKADKRLRIKDPTIAARKGKESEPHDVLAALIFMRTALRDPAVSDRDKGLWVSWALHLIADVHQPLHTSALFSTERWPKGDRGGNEVKIAGSGRKGKLDSLHYFWDSAISNRTEPREVDTLIAQLDAQEIDKVAKNEAQPLKWVREGRNIASRVVYDPLRAQLVASPEVKISSSYTKRAHAMALKRAALAARRTALWLEDALQNAPVVSASQSKVATQE